MSGPDHLKSNKGIIRCSGIICGQPVTIYGAIEAALAFCGSKIICGQAGLSKVCAAATIRSTITGESFREHALRSPVNITKKMRGLIVSREIIRLRNSHSSEGKKEVMAL